MTRQSEYEAEDDGYRPGLPGMGVGLAADWERGSPLDAPSSDFTRRVDGEGMLRRAPRPGPAGPRDGPFEVLEKPGPDSRDLSKGHKVSALDPDHTREP